MTMNNKFNIESKEDNSSRATSEKWNAQRTLKKHLPTKLVVLVGRKEEKPKEESMRKP